MKLNTSVKYMDYYIPEKTVSVDEILSMNKNISIDSVNNYDEFVQQFRKQSGLDRIAVLDSKDNLANIASDMVDKLFQNTDIKPSEIKYLVCGNRVLMDDNISTIHYIQKKFNLENAVILPIFQDCASTLIAMGISEKLLNKSAKEYMLVLTARKCPDIKGRYVGFTVMGDGLSLVLIENKPGRINITNWCSYNNGVSSYSKMEGSAKSLSVINLQMNIITSGVSFLQRSMKKIDIMMENIDKIIHPNTNYDVFHELYSNLLNIEPTKFYLDNIRNGGHINDVDLVRNTKDYIYKNKSQKKRMNVLIYGIDLVQSLDINYHIITLEISL
ncbi:MAG: hypothetical protein AB1422_04235 [bacterium]